MFRSTPFLVESGLVRAAEAVNANSLEEASRQTASSGAVNTVIARLQHSKNGTTPVAPAVFPTAEDLDAAGTYSTNFTPTRDESDILRSQVRIVSRFATQEVIKNLPTDIMRLRSLAENLSNGAILGYAFEEQLKNSLVEAVSTKSLSLTDETGVVDLLPVGSFEIWSEDAVEERLSRTIQDNTWVFVSGQQGLYDAIHVMSSSHIRFVQATVGKEHSLKLSILATTIQKLYLQNKWDWTHVDFVMLRPSNEKNRPFNIKQPDGALSEEIRRLDDQPWARNQEYWRQNIRIRFLDWKK